jgi:hypothetical protein
MKLYIAISYVQRRTSEDLVQAGRCRNDADLRHQHVLNAIYRRLLRQGMLIPYTET